MLSIYRFSVNSTLLIVALCMYNNKEQLQHRPFILLLN